MSETVLVVAAHPDDEMLGCAATMARHVAAGDTVHIVIVAEGATARDDRRDAAARADELASLRKASAAAAQAVGAQPPQFLGLPDNRLDGMDLLDVIKPIEAIADAIRPTIVYTHHLGDLNVDHSVVHRATLTACRPQPGSSVASIYAFEVLSSTGWGDEARMGAFIPQHFIDVSDFMEAKRAALESYAIEMRPFPHARSWETAEALARFRGGSVGVAAAEAFVVVRQIVTP